MRIMMFSSQPYDRDSFSAATLPAGCSLAFQHTHLGLDTAALANNCEVVCAFINDDLSAPVLQQLAAGGTRLIALRSAGYNHVDLQAAQQLGLSVVRVPAYSPFAIAEHAVALILALNRRIHRAFNRTREGDFSLHGLIGLRSARQDRRHYRHRPDRRRLCPHHGRLRLPAAGPRPLSRPRPASPWRALPAA